MTREDLSPPRPVSPSDDRLVDYLLGESADRNDAEHGLSDAAIEQWLAADERNTERLESLAVSILALSLPRDQGVCTAALDAVCEASAQETAVGAANQPLHCTVAPPATEASSTTGLRAVIAGLLATAAAITLAVYWPRDAAGPEELSTQRLAVAWIETASVTVPGSDLEDEWTGEWESSESDPWLLSDASEAFSSDQDSPPQWLLVAVDQMSLAAELQGADAEGLP